MGTAATAPAEPGEIEIGGELRAFLARLDWKHQNGHDRDFYPVFHRPAEDINAGTFPLALASWLANRLFLSRKKRFFHRVVQTSDSQRFGIQKMGALALSSCRLVAPMPNSAVADGKLRLNLKFCSPNPATLILN